MHPENMRAEKIRKSKGKFSCQHCGHNFPRQSRVDKHWEKGCTENPDVAARKGVVQVNVPRHVLEMVEDIEYEELPTGVNTTEAVNSLLTASLKKHYDKKAARAERKLAAVARR